MRLKSLITAVVLGVGLAGTGLAAAEATTPKPPAHSNPANTPCNDPSGKPGVDPSGRPCKGPVTKPGKPRLGVDKRGCPIKAGGCVSKNPTYTG